MTKIKDEYTEKLNKLYELGREEVINKMLRIYESVRDTNGTNADFGCLIIEYLKGELEL